MPLIKKDEVFPARPVMIIIVGTPFSYKTSLSITAKDPILFDSEKGSERAHGRAETYRIVTSWKEVETDLQGGLLAPFKTAILDTGGSIIDDYLWDYGLDIKYTKNLMQNWGTVKDLFKKFVSKIRLTGLDLVVISHEKSKDKNDETIYDLDISGGGKQLLLRQADQIGFISKKDFKEGQKIVTKTILTFWPTSTLPFCKNVAGLEDIVLPDCNAPEWEDFLNREVIQKTKDAIASMSEDQVKALALIAEWRETIDAIEAGETEATQKQIMDTYKEVLAIGQEHIKKQISAYFLSHIKGMNWKWDGKTKLFVPVTPIVAEVKTEATEQANEVVDPVEAKPVEAESNPAGIINPNPNLAKPKEDLFAPASN